MVSPAIVSPPIEGKALDDPGCPSSTAPIQGTRTAPLRLRSLRSLLWERNLKAEPIGPPPQKETKGTKGIGKTFRATPGPFPHRRQQREQRDPALLPTPRPRPLQCPSLQNPADHTDPSPDPMSSRSTSRSACLARPNQNVRPNHPPARNCPVGQLAGRSVGRSTGSPTHRLTSP
jgi:hypothetical protein